MTKTQREWDMKRKLKYPSLQNSFNRRTKTPLTSDADWCKDCGKFIPITWTEPPFSMPVRKCKCQEQLEKEGE